MASERIKLQGRRAELKQKIEEYEIRAQNHIITIRDLIDPYTDLTDMEVERAEQAMISLKTLAIQAREAKQTMNRIDQDLGNV